MPTFAGLLPLPWWGALAVAVLFTHATAMSVTIYLHRHLTHRALDLHPVASHAFRFWLWLTTGIRARDWVAIDRRHHAHTHDYPRNPLRERSDRETVERYGHGAPDDGVERNLYAGMPWLGPVVMALVDVGLFGPVSGAIIFGAQLCWIPLRSTGVVNWLGHSRGYRNWSTDDNSTNILAWGILLAGEELHHNHHAFPTSACFAARWNEIDLGWRYIRALGVLRLATVRRTMPTLSCSPGARAVDDAMMRAVLANRYLVQARFAEMLRTTCTREAALMAEYAPASERSTLRTLERWLQNGQRPLTDAECTALVPVLQRSRILWAVYSMRVELSALWVCSAASPGEMTAQLGTWCQRAETTGIAPLVEFSQRLRCFR